MKLIVARIIKYLHTILPPRMSKSLSMLLSLSDIPATSLVQQLEDASSKLDASEIITELQLELRSACAVASEVKKENEILQQKLEEAVTFSNAHLKRHAEWKEVWKKERELLSMRERQVEKDEAKCKSLMEDERRREELESKTINNNTNSNNSGALGVADLIKEIQTEHADKFESLINEAVKWKEQCFGTRKKYSELEARYEELQGRYDREREMTESFEKDIASLQHTIADHMIAESNNNSKSSVSLQATVRDLQVQVEEKEMRLELLLNEANAMRKARDDALCTKDELTAIHQIEQEKAIHDCAEQKSKNLALERRIQTVNKECAHAVSSKAELNETLGKINDDMAKLRESLIVKDEHIELLGKAATTMEHKLKTDIRAMNVNLVEAQEKIKCLEHQCLETQEHALKQINDLTKYLQQEDKGSNEKLLEAKERIHRLENTISDLQNEMKMQVNSHHAEIQKLEHAVTSCHKDLSIVLLEKQANDVNISEARMQVSQFQKLVEDSENTVRKLEIGQQTLRDENDSLNSKIHSLKNENETLTGAVEGLRLQKVLLSTEQEKEVSSLHDDLNKERRRRDAYKLKALESHSRSVKAKEVIALLCSNNK